MEHAGWSDTPNEACQACTMVVAHAGDDSAEGQVRTAALLRTRELELREAIDAALRRGGRHRGEIRCLPLVQADVDGHGRR